MSLHKLIYPFPTQESISETSTCDNILWDLGKATKRGTKKCLDCGFINGIRSYACKNPQCNRILKVSEKQKIGVHIDAIKLVSGLSHPTRQIYSVRVREKVDSHPSDRPDQRGFVQLPCAIYESEKLSEVALCFVDHCERSYSILKCHENENDDDDDYNDINNLDETNRNKRTAKKNVSLNFCAHIESAVRSLSVAHALEFKHDLINNLKVCDDVKKKLCSLAKSTEGPLVQRIAKNVMAIKCFVNSANPLGYLHFMLEFQRSATAEEEIDQFSCECNKLVKMKKCLHYYACICAFASDAKLIQKYSSFVQNEFDPCIKYDIISLLEDGKDSPYPLENIRIEILRPDLLGLPINKQFKQKAEKIRRAKLNEKAKVSMASNKKLQQIKVLANAIIKNSLSFDDDSDSNKNNLQILEYNEWLSFAIERINLANNFNSQTSVCFSAHVLNDLCQPSLIDVYEVKLLFHIPEAFFKIIQSQLYTDYGPYNNSRNDQNMRCPYFCLDEKQQYVIYNVAHLEQLFLLSNNAKSLTQKLDIYQLLLNEHYPFRINWCGSIYKTSNFGELEFTFVKRRL